jgi:hypothetical protein
METSRLYVEIGFQDEKLANEAYFFLDNLSGSSKWIARTGKGGAYTDTSIDMEADTSWHLFEIVSDGSTIVFRIDGETVASHSTNIPSEHMYPYAYIATKEGQTKRIRIDYAQITSDREG